MEGKAKKFSTESMCFLIVFLLSKYRLSSTEILEILSINL